MRNLIWLLVASFLFSCKDAPQDSGATPDTSSSIGYYDESYRLQYHFAPEAHWMNDPNGLVYHDGTYHLFYQYYPEDIVWGPMHWGHATSEDLLHWKHHPIALYPDDHGLIFSGSAVVDVNNSSGFGTSENPPMVAIFTYHSMEKEKAGDVKYQTQGMAYSLDQGETWTKYADNPIIDNPGMKDFRDPKVFWHEPSKQWILVLVAGDHAKFYKSQNLKEWTWMSDFGKNLGAHGGVWECPDLFPLKVNEGEEEKWVLFISINPGAPNGGSGTQYFVGDFDGNSFSTEQKEELWIDYGRDNYAGVTYNNVPDNKRVFIGWMSNWDYARNTPTEVWRSSMTLPRELSLGKDETGYFLKNPPIEGIKSIISKDTIIKDIDLTVEFKTEVPSMMEANINFDVQLSKEFHMAIGNDAEGFSFHIDPKNRIMTFDRSNSGNVAFEESFAKGVQVMPYTPVETSVDVQVYMDQSSVEIFVDGGRYVFTNQIFPVQPYNQLRLHGEATTIQQLEINKINSTWNEQ